MKPHIIGRTLGIGLRVAGRVVGQRVATGAQVEPNQPPAGAPAATTALQADAAARGRAAREAAARTAGGVGRGVAGFLRPFRRVGGILWLEVSGVFFLLFVVVFAPVAWRTRHSYAHGPDHRSFWAAAAIMALFLYLGITSFWNARKK
ncbi:MAG TPA: hypothetical protein VLZ50_14740 [Terracidiphilus sp.]|nr:hypothetical protein [Terracidiphilus sp.]